MSKQCTDDRSIANNSKRSSNDILCEDEKLLFHELVKFIADGNLVEDESVSKSDGSGQNSVNSYQNRNSDSLDDWKKSVKLNR